MGPPRAHSWRGAVEDKRWRTPLAAVGSPAARYRKPPPYPLPSAGRIPTPAMSPGCWPLEERPPVPPPRDIRCFPVNFVVGVAFGRAFA